MRRSTVGVVDVRDDIREFLTSRRARLTRAGREIGAQRSAVTLTGRVAAAGGAVAVLFAVITALMVWQPGH